MDTQSLPASISRMLVASLVASRLLAYLQVAFGLDLFSFPPSFCIISPKQAYIGIGVMALFAVIIFAMVLTGIGTAQIEPRMLARYIFSSVHTLLVVSLSVEGSIHSSF